MVSREWYDYTTCYGPGRTSPGPSPGQVLIYPLAVSRAGRARTLCTPPAVYLNTPVIFNPVCIDGAPGSSSCFTM